MSSGTMPKEERKDWVRRGYKDPVVAYRQHAAGAGSRGIEFKLTFAEWWSYWKDHYTNRGQKSGQLCMCRTGDVGPYAVGNVRIDTGKSNAQESALVQKQKLLASGRLPASERALSVHSDNSGWVFSRSKVFEEYIEEELDY